MNSGTLSKTEAAQALGDADRAGARMATLSRYAVASPFMILWGCIWLAANAVTDFKPIWSGKAWMVGMVVGVPATIWFSRKGGVARPGDDPARAKDFGRRFNLMWLAIWTFMAATAVILGPMTMRQGNAFLSLSGACLYMGFGAWMGWRLFAIGALTAAAILFGFLVLQQHYFLWMAVVGGGSLIAGGLWLRKV